MKSLLATLMGFIRSVLSFIPALVYEYVYSEFYTKYVDRHIESLTSGSHNASNSVQQRTCLMSARQLATRCTAS
jgi:hypothetical protein